MTDNVNHVEKNKHSLDKDESFKEKYYYLAAEMQNMKDLFNKEQISIIEQGSEKILSSLLSVMDNSGYTLSAVDKETDEKIKNIASGIYMIKKQLLEVLNKNGLEEIKALGEIFNPQSHEVLSSQVAKGAKEDEIILECQKGYTLNGRLLRASKVIIAKNN